MADEERPKLAVLISTSRAFSGGMNRCQRYHRVTKAAGTYSMKAAWITKASSNQN